MRPKKFLVSQIPIFYTLWLVSWFFNFSLHSFFLFIIHFFPLFFFPSLCLQLPIPPASPITSSSDCIPTLSLFISFTVSARGFQVPEDFFIFNHFLLYCLSACHCLCLTQPPLLPAMGKSLFLIWQVCFVVELFLFVSERYFWSYIRFLADSFSVLWMCHPTAFSLFVTISQLLIILGFLCTWGVIFFFRCVSEGWDNSYHQLTSLKQ